MNPNKFITSTDWATLKNDAIGQIALTIPNGAIIPPFGSTTWYTEMQLGTRNASMRTQMQSSLKPTEWTPGNMRVIDMNLNYAGTPSLETGVVSIIRTTPTTVRLYCTHFNTAPFNISVIGNQTITANVSTFLSPFN